MKEVFQDHEWLQARVMARLDWTGLARSKLGAQAMPTHTAEAALIKARLPAGASSIEMPRLDVKAQEMNALIAYAGSRCSLPGEAL